MQANPIAEILVVDNSPYLLPLPTNSNIFRASGYTDYISNVSTTAQILLVATDNTANATSITTSTMVPSPPPTIGYSSTPYNGYNATEPYAYTERSSGIPLQIQILMCLVYGTLAFTAITSNMIVCYIVLSNQRMRTATNYFIVNLAVGDILMAALCIPFTFPANLIFNSWPFGLSLCVIVSYSQALSVFISAYTMVAISIDKYRAIMYPMRLRMPKIQAKIIILVIWSLALITSLPTAILSNLEPPLDYSTTIPTSNVAPSVYPQAHTSTLTPLPHEREWNLESSPTNGFNEPVTTLAPTTTTARLTPASLTSQHQEKKYFCQESWTFWPPGKYYYSMALMILQFVLPLFVLVITYSRIVIVVWGKRAPGEEDNARDARMARSKRKMIKMVIFCVIAFALTWLPFNALIVIGDMHPVIWENQNISYIWFITHYLAMCHTITNPLIYIWMNNRFRVGFKQVMGDLCRPIQRLILCICCCCILDSSSRKRYFRVSTSLSENQRQQPKRLTQRTTTSSESFQIKANNNRTGGGSAQGRPMSLLRSSSRSPTLYTTERANEETQAKAAQAASKLGASSTAPEPTTTATAFDSGYSTRSHQLDREGGAGLADNSGGRIDLAERRLAETRANPSAQVVVELGRESNSTPPTPRQQNRWPQRSKSDARSAAADPNVATKRHLAQSEKRKRHSHVISIQMTSIEYRKPTGAPQGPAKSAIDCARAKMHKGCKRKSRWTQKKRLAHECPSCGPRAECRAEAGHGADKAAACLAASPITSPTSAAAAPAPAPATNSPPDDHVRFSTDVRRSSQSTATTSMQTNTTSLAVSPLNSQLGQLANLDSSSASRLNSNQLIDGSNCSEELAAEAGVTNNIPPANPPNAEHRDETPVDPKSTTSGSFSCSEQAALGDMNLSGAESKPSPVRGRCPKHVGQVDACPPQDCEIVDMAREDSLATDDDTCDVFHQNNSNNIKSVSFGNNFDTNNVNINIRQRSNRNKSSSSSLELLSDQFEENNSLEAEYGDGSPRQQLEMVLMASASIDSPSRARPTRGIDPASTSSKMFRSVDDDLNSDQQKPRLPTDSRGVAALERLASSRQPVEPEIGASGSRQRHKCCAASRHLISASSVGSGASLAARERSLRKAMLHHIHLRSSFSAQKDPPSPPEKTPSSVSSREPPPAAAMLERGGSHDCMSRSCSSGSHGEQKIDKTRKVAPAHNCDQAMPTSAGGTAASSEAILPLQNQSPDGGPMTAANWSPSATSTTDSAARDFGSATCNQSSSAPASMTNTCLLSTDEEGRLNRGINGALVEPDSGSRLARSEEGTWAQPAKAFGHLQKQQPFHLNNHHQEQQLSTSLQTGINELLSSLVTDKSAPSLNNTANAPRADAHNRLKPIETTVISSRTAEFRKVTPLRQAHSTTTLLVRKIPTVYLINKSAAQQRTKQFEADGRVSGSLV